MKCQKVTCSQHFDEFPEHEIKSKYGLSYCTNNLQKNDYIVFLKKLYKKSFHKIAEFVSIDIKYCSKNV